MDFRQHESDSHRRNSVIRLDSQGRRVSEISKSHKQVSISKQEARGSVQGMVRNIHRIEEQILDSNSVFIENKMLNASSSDIEGAEILNNKVDKKDDNRRLNEKFSIYNMKMSDGQGSKYLGISDGRINVQAIRYENKEEDATQEYVNMIPVDHCIDNLHTETMDLGGEEMSDSRYEQSSSRREREMEYNSAKQSYRDYLDLVHDSLESSFRDSVQDDTEIPLSRTHKVANLISLNISCASSGSESACTEKHKGSIGSIESSDEKDRAQHKDITRIFKKGANLLPEPITQTTGNSDSSAKNLDSTVGIRFGSHADLRKRTKMESKEKVDNLKKEMHDDSTGSFVDSSNVHIKSDINSPNQILPSKENSYSFIINAYEKEHSIRQEDPHLLSEESQPSPILMNIPTSHSTIQNSSASPQEPSNISHKGSELPNPTSSTHFLESNLPQYSDAHSESSNQIEPDNIITFQYPIPNIIIQTSSTDSLPQTAPNMKFSLKLKPRVDYLVPKSNNPLYDISSADKVYDRHELVYIKHSDETEHHYTSHLNWWDNVRSRLIQKYGIDMDRSISEKYARDLRGMRYILKNPFDKSNQQPEERTSVIEVISKKIKLGSSISEGNGSQGSDITENRGMAGNNLSKEIKMNKTSLKADRNNAKQKKSKDAKQVKQMESLESISEKKPRRVVKSFSKSMVEDKSVIKKKQNEAKDQDIKKHHRSSSNSHQTDTRPSQVSIAKHSPITQSNKMSIHSKSRSHNRLPSISSKDTTSFNIHSRSNLNSSSITRTIDGSLEKKASYPILNSNSKTDTTRKVLNLDQNISIGAPSHKSLSKHHSVILKSSPSNSSSELINNSMTSKITESKYTPSRDDSFSIPSHFKTVQSLPKSSSPLRPLKSLKPLEFYKGSCNKHTLSKKVLSNYKYLAYLDTDFNSSPSQLVLLYPDIKVTTAQDLTKAYGVSMETIKNKVMPISSSFNI